MLLEKDSVKRTGGNPLFTNRKVHLAGAYSSVKIRERWKVCIKGHLTVPCCSVSAAHAAGSGIPDWLPGHWVAAAGSCTPSLTTSLWLAAGSVTRYHRKWVGKTSLGWKVWKNILKWYHSWRYTGEHGLVLQTQVLQPATRLPFPSGKQLNI